MCKILTVPNLYTVNRKRNIIQAQHFEIKTTATITYVILILHFSNNIFLVD